MYKQGCYTAFSLENAKNFQDARYPHFLIEYPSPCHVPPNFNAGLFPKDKFDIGGQLCVEKKLKKRKKCKSKVAYQVNSDYMVHLSNAIPHGAPAKVSSKPQSPSNLKSAQAFGEEKRKVGGCEGVEQTCTEFMEIVQDAVQETVEETAKAIMQNIYEKIACQMDEISREMREVKEVVCNVGEKNDLRFKCICEFLFAHLQTADAADNSKEGLPKKCKLMHTSESKAGFLDCARKDFDSNVICCCRHTRLGTANSSNSPKPQENVKNGNKAASVIEANSSNSPKTQENVKNRNKSAPVIEAITRNSQKQQEYVQNKDKALPEMGRNSNISSQQEEYSKSRTKSSLSDKSPSKILKKNQSPSENDKKEEKYTECPCPIHEFNRRNSYCGPIVESCSCESFYENNTSRGCSCENFYENNISHDEDCTCEQWTNLGSKKEGRINNRKSKVQLSASCCSCDKIQKASSSPRVRKVGGMHRMGYISRWRTCDFKPSTERTEILQKHCSRIDNDVKKERDVVEMKLSFPEIMIDGNDLDESNKPVCPPAEYEDKICCTNPFEPEYLDYCIKCDQTRCGPNVGHNKMSRLSGGNTKFINVTLSSYDPDVMFISSLKEQNN